MIENLHIVEETGLILVSRGEAVVTQQGSEAVLSSVRGGSLVLEFPVEIEVRIVPACDPEQHVETTLARLTSAIEGLA